MASHDDETTSGERKWEEDVHHCVDVLQSCVDRWSRYWIDSARLATQGNLNAGEWAELYAKMWRGLAEDVGRVVKRSAERK
jgi:hypothetical protein